MKTLALDTVNQLILKKHHLTEDTKINDILRITNDLCGLHATETITPYLTLFARTNSFIKEDLDKLLYEEKKAELKDAETKLDELKIRVAIGELLESDILIRTPGIKDNVETLRRDVSHLENILRDEEIKPFGMSLNEIFEHELFAREFISNIDDLLAEGKIGGDLATRLKPEMERILATILLTDIVRSTDRAAELGDQKWRELLNRHDALVERALTRFRGHLVDKTGDGILATFDGPARAIRCATTIIESIRGIGLEVRAGLHTGEVEIRGDRLAGIAVHIASRVSDQAGASEVLVSSTVKDLVAGSGISFADRGNHVLKGVPNEWQLFAAT